VWGAGPIRNEKVQPNDAMGQRDFGGCMRFARGSISTYRLGVAHGCGELSEKKGAAGRPFDASARTTALSGIAFLACILSCAWCGWAAESQRVGGKRAQAGQEAARQGIPDDYVEGPLTFVLHRVGAMDMP
jgi:hypothetical protein